MIKIDHFTESSLNSRIGGNCAGLSTNTWNSFTLLVSSAQSLTLPWPESGTAYKMKGRVGDSPIIGSGLYVDNTIGAAVATGLGEEVIKTVGSFLIVELMKQASIKGIFTMNLPIFNQNFTTCVTFFSLPQISYDFH